jgi:hypothetical protein
MIKESKVRRNGRVHRHFWLEGAFKSSRFHPKVLECGKAQKMPFSTTRDVNGWLTTERRSESRKFIGNNECSGHRRFDFPRGNPEAKEGRRIGCRRNINARTMSRSENRCAILVAPKYSPTANTKQPIRQKENNEKENSPIDTNTISFVSNDLRSKVIRSPTECIRLVI